MFIVRLPNGQQHQGTHTSIYKTAQAALSSLNPPLTPTIKALIPEHLRDVRLGNWNDVEQRALWHQKWKEVAKLRKKLGAMEYWKLLELDGYKLIEVEIVEKE